MVIVYERELTHYRVPVFSRLQKRMEEEVFVVHGDEPQQSHLNTVDEGEDLVFRHKRAPTYWIGRDKMAIQNVIPHLLKRAPDVVIVRGGIRQLHLFPLLLFYKLQGIPTIVWGQGYSRKRKFRPRHHLIDRAHLSVVQLSDAYVCYNKRIKSTLSEYCPSEKLFVASNTLPVEKHLETREELQSIGQETIRRQLNLECPQYLCFIGRLQPRKRVDYLLDVYQSLRSRFDVDVGLIVVGDGPERPELEAKAQKEELRDVYFVGEQYGKDAGRYLVAADAMVMPGWLGLAVNHSFAYGLPVISQHSDDRENGVTHAPESIHVRHGETGWLAAPGNKKEMIEGIQDVLSNIEAYSERCLHYAQANLTMESMIDGFIEAISYARKK